MTRWIDKSKLLGVGRTAEVFSWGAGKVIKLFFSWYPHDLIESEFNINKSIQDFEIPIPSVFEIIKIENRSGIIYERVPGNSLLEEFISTPEKTENIGCLLAKYHFDFHKIKAKHLIPLHVRLSKGIEKNELLTEQKRFISQVLANLPEGDNLLHMDYHPGQILQSDQGEFILDWGAACKGNPLADVASTVVLLRIAEIHTPRTISQNNYQDKRLLLSETYLKQYSELQDNFSEKEMDKWILVIATSRLSEAIPGESKKLNCLIQEKLNKIKTN